MAFEVRLRQDEELRRRVELWQAQSEAIRSTFGATARTPGARQPCASAAPQARGEPAELGNRQTSSSPAGAQAPRNRPWRPRRAAMFAAFVLIGVTLFPGAMAYPPRGALGDTGAAAFRAFSASPTAALDFRGADAEGLSDFLGPAFVAAGLTEWVAPGGWRLRGAKRVPGLQGEAALALLEGAEKRPLGVLVEPLDAPASSAVRVESRDGSTTAAFTRRGYGVTVVGRSADDVRAWLSASGFLDEGSPHPMR